MIHVQAHWLDWPAKFPPADQLALWRQDYQTTRSEMFFGGVPKFEDILHVVGDFEKRFNQSSLK